jgi:hypothetical protein
MLSFQLGDIVYWKICPGVEFCVATTWSNIPGVVTITRDGARYTALRDYLTHATPLTPRLEDLLDEDHVPVR